MMNMRRLPRTAFPIGAVMLLLAGCAGPNGAGGPLAGWQNPFGSLAGMDPDLRGRLGGALDTSGPGSPAQQNAGGVTDPFAGQGVRAPQIPPAPGSATAPAAPSGSVTVTPATTATIAASSHVVAAGETAWSISRKYGVAVTDLAAANGLPEAMTVRVGQKLSIPAAGTRTAAAVTAPGAGSPTPQPPSASKPLPTENTLPASTQTPRPQSPDLGATRTAASGNGQFSMPVNGSIVRAYAKGRNEGIDISAPSGTAVKAAGTGTVAAITSDTDGVPIVVIRHDGTLMTVYAGIDRLTVAKGDQVNRGQTIGTATPRGVVHFEVRKGFDSVDPEGYLG